MAPPHRPSNLPRDSEVVCLTGSPQMPEVTYHIREETSTYFSEYPGPGQSYVKVTRTRTGRVVNFSREQVGNVEMANGTAPQKH